MKGKIHDINEKYALIKLPDGRTMNMKVENLPSNVKKGHEIHLTGEIPPSME
ncbi:hypothetical protein Q428_04260 [Fervidicella metallireducens AeB]|uniref:Uncharacterized protein n=1 Tax=Fervidicella metallireducens AeB TaxID=1403537 RepID=A0A017RWM3_9CLOT|nr:hypothetical protein [Fervidicella metallireducens]EYE89173.1 hypothetical protein Q428_04260 [Fervidicella metallireducens AeB]